MKFIPLTAEQRRQFNEEGYLIVRGALDAATIASLIAAGDRLCASDLTEGRQRTNDGRYDGFRNCITLDDAFIPLLAHPNTLPLIVQLFGPNIHFMTSHLIYKHPDEPGTPVTRREPNWHRDIAGTTTDLGEAHVPRMEMKCAFYLTPLTERNWGSTLFVPGSNHLKERIHFPEGAVDPVGAIEPLLNPGDAVFFENRTWHAATVNLSPHTRKAVMLGYGYRWLAPMDYIQQPDSLLDKVDDIGKQLLGGLRDPQGRFIPGGINKPLVDWCNEHGVTHHPPG